MVPGRSVWGRLGLGFSSFCGQQLVVEKVSGDGEDGVCRYSRLGADISKLVDCRSLYVYPQPPIHYPEYVTGYVMVRFKEPIVVGKGASARFWVHIDFDIVVVAGLESDSARVIDAFSSTGRGKYALYGPPNRGVLVRYVKAQPVTEPVAEQCRGLAPITITNRGLQTVEITRIVFPALHTAVYFDSRGFVYYPEIRVTTTSHFTAIVNVSDKPPMPKLEKAPQLAKPRGIVGVQAVGFNRSPSYVMTHGL